MKRLVDSCQKLHRDEGGQVSLEYAALLIASMVVGFLLLIAMAQVVDVLYGGVESEVSKPSHH